VEPGAERVQHRVERRVHGLPVELKTEREDHVTYLARDQTGKLGERLSQKHTGWAVVAQPVIYFRSWKDQQVRPPAHLGGAISRDSPRGAVPRHPWVWRPVSKEERADLQQKPSANRIAPMHEHAEGCRGSPRYGTVRRTGARS
jgi:hypothetical protein